MLKPLTQATHIGTYTHDEKATAFSSEAHTAFIESDITGTTDSSAIQNDFVETLNRFESSQEEVKKFDVLAESSGLNLEEKNISSNEEGYLSPPRRLHDEDIIHMNTEYTDESAAVRSDYPSESATFDYDTFPELGAQQYRDIINHPKIIELKKVLLDSDWKHTLKFLLNYLSMYIHTSECASKENMQLRLSLFDLNEEQVANLNWRKHFQLHEERSTEEIARLSDKVEKLSEEAHAWREKWAAHEKKQKNRGWGSVVSTMKNCDFLAFLE